MCQGVKVSSAVERVSPPPPRTFRVSQVETINIMRIKRGTDLPFGKNSLIMWIKELPGANFFQKARSFFPGPPPEPWGLHDTCMPCSFYRSVNITGQSGLSGSTHLPWHTTVTCSELHCLLVVASVRLGEESQVWVLSVRFFWMQGAVLHLFHHSNLEYERIHSSESLYDFFSSFVIEANSI